MPKRLLIPSPSISPARENTFRSGFAAALEPPVRGRSFDQAAEYLSRNYPEAYRKESFRQGFERGRHYYEKLAQAEVGR